MATEKKENQMDVDAVSDVVDVDALVAERLMAGMLQPPIPPTGVTILPNRKQMLFLAPKCGHAYSSLTLQYMDLPTTNTNDNKYNKNENSKHDDTKWSEACDFSSIASLNTELSLEQKLLRERQRNSVHGISSYQYHIPSNQILFQYGPHLVLSQIPSEIESPNTIPTIKIGDPSKDDCGTRMDPNLTSDGAFIVFARNDNLFMTTAHPNLLKVLKDGKPYEMQLTFADTDNDITAGVADFINQEEFDRFTGYWLSPKYRDFKNDGNEYREYSVLYLEADNSAVPSITIPSMDGVETHKWPRAGETNCKFNVKIATVAVPLSCCIEKSLQNANKENVIVNDYTLKQSIYSSYPWIEYIVRAGWTERDNNKRECFIQFLDRNQMKSNIVLYDFDAHFVDCNDSKKEEMKANDDDLSGDVLMECMGSPWINVHDSFKFIKDGLIWTSEHTGFRHLYFIPYSSIESKMIGVSSSSSDDNNKNAATDCTQVNMRMNVSDKCAIQQLTKGKWGVEIGDIWVDSKSNNDGTCTVYFQARKDSHLESHLYSVQFDPKITDIKQAKQVDNDGKIARLTDTGYFHDVHMDTIGFDYFVSVFSNIETPRVFSVHSIKNSNSNECVLWFSIPKRLEPKKIKYVTPELVEIVNFPDNASEMDKKNADFIDLHTFTAAIYAPFDAEYEKSKKYKKGGYPTIIQVYGGPHVQLVRNSWDRVAGNARIQMWRTLGYTVAMIDGRGSFNRGLAFEGRIKYKMGTVEMQDQVKLVEYLVEKGLTDKNRVAITGYSYGGYMSLMAMCQRPDVFKIGICGAPVTKWELYDTGYTERYMGTPQEQKEGYDNGSVLKYVKNFPDQENRVVIIHGLADENVHMFHTSKLINSMVKAAKPYVLKIFPGERHGVRQSPNVTYMEKFIINHLEKYLI